jgi:hypothetical protein
MPAMSTINPAIERTVTPAVIIPSCGIVRPTMPDR